GVLRKAAQGSGTLESKRRLEQLIGRIEGPPGGSKLRDHRAVELVEWIGSAAAKELLERGGKGEPESRLTQEADKALKRVQARREPIPVPDAGWPKSDALGDPLRGGAILRLGSTRWRMESDEGPLFYTPDGQRLVVAGSATRGVVNVNDGKVVAR